MGGQTIIEGMGELHLEIIVDRMKREFSVECNVGAPQVAYREAITQSAEIDYTHKKQSGGSGQYARIKLVFSRKNSVKMKILWTLNSHLISREDQYQRNTFQV